MAENSLPLKTRRLIAPLLTFIIVIVLALLIGAIAVAITGKSPLLAIQELFRAQLVHKQVWRQL